MLSLPKRFASPALHVGIALLPLMGVSLNVYAQTAPFQWRDSSAHSRVIVNATQGIESIPRDWLTKDWLITDYSITDVAGVGATQAPKQYAATRALLDSYGLAVGTYISGTLVIPEKNQFNHYPTGLVLLEWMPDTARYEKHFAPADLRRMIDVTDPATRAAFQQGVRRIWQQFPAPVRLVDNAAVHRSAGVSQPWSAYCLNIGELRKLAESTGSVAIFNIAAHVGELSDEEMEQLIAAVGTGGIMLEMPWEPGIRRNAAATNRAKTRYRQLLDRGVAIIMAPPGAEFPPDVAAWVNTWRKPEDHLYLAGAFYLQSNPKIYAAPAATKNDGKAAN